MSISKSIDVFCDDCGSWEPGHPARTAAGARKIVRQSNGYVRRRIGGVLTDLCPDCAKKREAVDAL